MIRKIYMIAGIALFLFGIWTIKNAITYTVESAKKGSALLKQVDNTISANSKAITRDEIPRGAVAPVMAIPTIGKSLGKIVIPKISLTAPLVEGTDHAQISKAVGHLTTSVLPGEIGCSVLAGHNITWFKDINKLNQNDQINVHMEYGDFTFKVIDHKLVHVGDPINNTSIPSIILETCYPFNSVTLTNQRYLIVAEMTDSSLKRMN